jgi:N4-gp56 family major capsid protein
MIRTKLDPSPKYNTSPIEARYVVYAHTDLAADIRDLPGFVHKAFYSNYSTMHEMELGSVEEFCFVVSPEFDNFIDSGAAVGSTGLVSTSASNIDVYPVAVVAKDFWGHLALRGEDAIKPIHVPNTPSAADPLGQRGYVGARWHMVAEIQNDGWGALIECGVRTLT